VHRTPKSFLDTARNPAVALIDSAGSQREAASPLCDAKATTKQGCRKSIAAKQSLQTKVLVTRQGGQPSSLLHRLDQGEAHGSLRGSGPSNVTTYCQHTQLMWGRGGKIWGADRALVSAEAAARRGFVTIHGRRTGRRKSARRCAVAPLPSPWFARSPSALPAMAPAKSAPSSAALSSWLRAFAQINAPRSPNDESLTPRVSPAGAMPAAALLALAGRRRSCWPPWRRWPSATSLESFRWELKRASNDHPRQGGERHAR